jgi:hypothetical protein
MRLMVGFLVLNCPRVDMIAVIVVKMQLRGYSNDQWRGSYASFSVKSESLWCRCLVARCNVDVVAAAVAPLVSTAHPRYRDKPDPLHHLSSPLTAQPIPILSSTSTTSQSCFANQPASACYDVISVRVHVVGSNAQSQYKECLCDLPQRPPTFRFYLLHKPNILSLSGSL